MITELDTRLVDELDGCLTGVVIVGGSEENDIKVQYR